MATSGRSGARMQAGDLIGAREVDMRLSDHAKWEFGASARYEATR